MLKIRHPLRLMVLSPAIPARLKGRNREDPKHAKDSSSANVRSWLQDLPRASLVSKLQRLPQGGTTLQLIVKECKLKYL